jgi:hypothetical protein
LRDIFSCQIILKNIFGIRISALTLPQLKHKNMNTEIFETHWFEHNGKNYAFEAEVEFKFEGFDGIGFYEFGGWQSYDKGNPTWDVVNVTIKWVHDPDAGEFLDLATLSPDLIATIKEFATEHCEEPEYCID